MSKMAGCLGRRTSVGGEVYSDFGRLTGLAPIQRGHGEAVDIVFREGERPPASLPAVFLAMSPNYRGPAYIPDDPKVGHIAPIDRFLDFSRLHRLMIPLAPS